MNEPSAVSHQPSTPLVIPGASLVIPSGARNLGPGLTSRGPRFLAPLGMTDKADRCPLPQRACLAVSTALVMLSQAWSAVILPERQLVSSTLIASLHFEYQGSVTAGTASSQVEAVSHCFSTTAGSFHFAQPVLMTSLFITDW